MSSEEPCTIAKFSESFLVSANRTFTFLVDLPNSTMEERYVDISKLSPNLSSRIFTKVFVFKLDIEVATEGKPDWYYQDEEEVENEDENEEMKPQRERE